MRLARVQLVGPSGVEVKIEANGEGELVIETRGPLVLIRDTGLPPHDRIEPAVQGEKPPARIVAQFSAEWAIFPEWEQTEPPVPTI